MANVGADIVNGGIKTDALALNANRFRVGWCIQNLGTNPLYVKFGSNASTNDFHFVLAGGNIINDGRGAMMQDVIYNGVVTVAGTSLQYSVAEIE